MNASNPTEPGEEEIAALAHAIWEDEGRPEGRDKEHWFMARERAAGRADPEAGEAGRDHTYVRPAGTDRMEMAPASWSKTDEESDESFPASDPPGNY
jgi:hypothetical protein